MIYMLVGLMFGGAAFILGCAVYGKFKLKDNSMEKYERRALLLSAGTVASYATGILMKTEFLALLFFGICTLLECFAVLSVFFFVRQYIGVNKDLGIKKSIIYSAAIFDSAIMLINPFINFVFKAEPYYLESGIYIYRISDFMPIYTFHLIFLLIMGLLILIMLLSKMINAPGAYMIKYSTIFISLAVIATVSASHVYFRFMFDYSLLLYAAAAFFIFYYSLIYIPRGLMDRLLFFTVATMNDGIICIDADGKIVHSNKAAKDYCEADAVIMTLENQVKSWFIENIDGRTATRTWETQRRIEGFEHYYSIEYRRIFDSSLKYLGCFFLIHDKTEEYIKYHAEKYRATHDALTGLYNKDYFCEQASEMMDNNPEKDYYIIVTDVKNFKIVNDVFGVESGDNLLKKIADITSSVGGINCIYGRLTGDKFTICMQKEQFSEDEMLNAYSVLDSFIDNADFKIHIHIGVYEVTDRNIRVSLMCDRANLAIKTIKESYRSFVAYYDSRLRESFINEHRVISEFERAINEEQFRLYIQPQIFADGKIIGGEALVRWFHPEDGMIPPDKFIKIFERTGLISKLDKFIWELACMKLSCWTEMGLENSYISINISQKDFYLINVYDVIISLVKKYDISPKRLHLEITETAMMDNPQAQLELVARLRSEGFIVEIDDFGSGYSSLNMLKDFDADVLKIDMGFLQKTERQEKSHSILKMIITLAKLLNMEVITEGVETKNQVDFLAEYGCDIYQGYYFAKPMPVEDFEKDFLNVTVEI